MRMRIAVMAFALMFVLEWSATAATLFYDDFEDGNATDGSPVEWNDTYFPWNNGVREVIDGSYVLTPSLQAVRPNYWENDSNVEGLLFHDFSIRTQARVLGTENGVAVGFNARDTHPQSPDGQTGRNIFAWLGTDGSLEVGVGTNNTVANSISALTQLRPADYDVTLRLDVIGELVKFWAWPTEGTRPATPQLTYILPGRPPTSYNVPGQVGIWNGQVDVGSSGVTVPVAFRYVEVVPEPSTLVIGVIACAGLIGTCRRRRR